MAIFPSECDACAPVDWRHPRVIRRSESKWINSRYVVSSSERGSFSAVSRAIGQPAVSKQEPPKNSARRNTCLAIIPLTATASFTESAFNDIEGVARRNSDQVIFLRFARLHVEAAAPCCRLAGCISGRLRDNIVADSMLRSLRTSSRLQIRSGNVILVALPPGAGNMPAVFERRRTQ